MVTGTCSYAACSLPGWHQDGEWLFCTQHVGEHEALMAADGELVKATDVQRFTPEARRKQIGQLIDRGLGTAEIAAALGLTYHSVRIYRRELKRPQDLPAAQCGTRTGKQRHKARGEAICEPCVEADRAYFAERYRQRRKVAA